MSRHALLDSHPIPTAVEATGSQQSASAGGVVEFDQEVLRNTLIRAAGGQLVQVAKSSTAAIGDQLQSIQRSIEDYQSVIAGMRKVQSDVQQIDEQVGVVLEESRGSSQELEEVCGRMGVLEEHFSAVSRLIKSVNRIADQTHLLALNANIEAARAGEAGRGFAVVASEVKDLAGTTKHANQEISQSLDRIAEAVSSLSVSVKRSAAKMQQSMTVVEETRESALSIARETSGFAERLQESLQSFNRLDASAVVVENELKEIGAIGETFANLLELMVMQGIRFEGVDPLERLAPIVAASTFRASERFTRREPEYVLRADDILISATDTRGKISFANNRFYEVAEYEPGELIGRPHNTIRHPDMPKTAFADLWKVIKAGKLWQGYVVNLSKNGRRYWVKANVFPCFARGQINGYISIRTKPEPQQIAQAIEAYRRLP